MNFGLGFNLKKLGKRERRSTFKLSAIDLLLSGHQSCITRLQKYDIANARVWRHMGIC